MITIELGNLEHHMAEMLGALLDIPSRMSHAIYFTPKNTIARVEVVQAVLNEQPECQMRDDVGSLLGMVKSAMQRRHVYIHKVWGVSEDTGEVSMSSPPVRASVPVPLTDLTNLIADFRQASTAAIEMTPAIHETLHVKTGALTPSRKKPGPKKSPERDR